MLALAVSLVAAGLGVAQTTSPGPVSPPPAVAVPAPIPPDVIARGADGRVTVRATRLAERIVLDGQLTEGVYTTTASFGDFIQQEPDEGRPATERSEVWIFFDNVNVYVAARFWKSNPADLIANEMRKDEMGIFRNDCIGVVLDTFHDRRSGYYFNTNALGAVRDALLVNENQNANLDFNAVWDVRSHRFAEGWSTEMAIPFKSLRYPGQREQTWGLLVQRIDWKKNEMSYLTSIPASYGGAGIWKVSSSATLVGIEAPERGGRLEVKPYTVSSLTTDRTAAVPVSNDGAIDVGLDARYRLTRSLNVDVTYNTDFAQVEVDSQQLNLSRFTLFYPEKREFFLEMQNILSFGPTTGPGGQRAANDPTPILFFSRQIGLADGQAIPVIGGGRLLGRAGGFTIGAFSMRTAAADGGRVPATTFSTVRVRRNVLRRSAVGMLATRRSPSGGRDGSNTVIGTDANLRFRQDIEFNGYVALSQTAGKTHDTASYLAQFRYAGDRYGAEATRLGVGTGFDPQMGFVPRRGFVRNYGFVRFSPRPARWPGIRKVGWEGSIDRINASSGTLETRDVKAVFRLVRAAGDEVNATVDDLRDRPQTAFTVAGATIAPGDYRFRDLRVNYLLGPQRRIVGTMTAAHGGFYGGDRSDAGYTGRLSLTSRFMVEPSLSVTRLRMPTGTFTAQLIGARTTVAMSPRMFATALLQYNSGARRIGANVRFRWEYRPGSDVFVVYSDGRDTRTRGVPDLLNRSIAVKVTRLFQM
jgi:hypothetical protein